MTAKKIDEQIEWAGNDDDWLNDSEEEMLAEDALWEDMFARNAGMFNAFDEEAEIEIELGLTQPMFDGDGLFLLETQ